MAERELNYLWVASRSIPIISCSTDSRSGTKQTKSYSNKLKNSVQQAATPTAAPSEAQQSLKAEARSSTCTATE